MTVSVPEVTVILPTHNERESVPRVIGEIHQALSGTEHEIIVVDHHSPDGTGQWVEAASQHDRSLRLVWQSGAAGLSAAVLQGFRAARSDRWVVMDADGQHEPAILPVMCRALAAHELVVASRYARGGSTGRWSPARWVGSRVATWLAQLILNVALSDPLSGYFGIRREAFADVAATANPAGFKILLELYYRLNHRRDREGVLCIEVPYRFRQRVAGESKLTRAVIWHYLRMLMKLRREESWPQGLPKFLCVGAMGVVVNSAALWMLVHHLGWPYLVSSPVAIQLSIVHNFIWHDRWTFNDRRANGTWFARLKSYEVVTLAGMALNWVLLMVLVGWAGQPLLLANLCGIAAGTLLNFAMSKLWAWKRQPCAVIT
jgi:dolichol-phosphate mannosyltransferase